MNKEQKIKYCYCVGEALGGYFPNEYNYEYSEVLKEVENYKKDVLSEIEHIKISDSEEEFFTKEELISDVLYNNNPIKIFKELVDYEDDMPIGSELLECVKTINILN